MFLKVPLAVATLRLTMNEKPSVLVKRTQSLSDFWSTGCYMK
jgi:hypothetical protein